MKYPKIIRKGGPYRRKFGIHIEYLNTYQKRLLYNNPLLRTSCHSDQFVLALFKIADMEKSHKQKHKIYLNPYTESFTKYDKIEEESKKIDWNCAICSAQIISNIDNFKVENFLCEECLPAHAKSKNIDKRIMNSSLKFRKHCQKLLIKEQKKFLKYAKNFFKKSRLNH